MTINDPQYRAVFNQLKSSNFQDTGAYAKNKSYINHVIQSLKNSKLDSKELEPLLKAVDHAISDLRIAQYLISDSKKSKTESLLTKVSAFLKNKYYKNPRLSKSIKSLSEIAKENKISIENIPARAKLKEIGQKVKVLGKGSTTVGTKVLDEKYWKETIGLKLSIDGGEYSGKMYMGHFSLERAPKSVQLNPNERKSYFEIWQTGKDEKNVPFQARHSFEDFMNVIVIPKLSPEEKKELKKACMDVVEYYTPEERQNLQISFKDGLLCTNTDVLTSWVKRQNACTTQQELESESFRSFVEKQKDEKSTQGLHQVPTANAPYMYVLDAKGHLFVQLKQRGKANHTSLGLGHAVKAAGMVTIKDGQVISINTSSGHYAPGKLQLLTLLESLQKNGVDIDKINVTYSTVDSQGNLDPHEIKSGAVNSWIEKEKVSLVQGIQDHLIKRGYTEKTFPISIDVLKKMAPSKLQDMLERAQTIFTDAPPISETKEKAPE